MAGDEIVAVEHGASKENINQVAIMSSSFEDLEVWKKSCKLSVKLYELLKDCPDYGLKNQMLRAAVSIPSNIAEGSERNSIPDFQRFLNIAKGSAAELRTQIYISREVKIFSNVVAKELIQELKSISKMLQALHNSFKNRES
jgi:four helix bundle protein